MKLMKKPLIWSMGALLASSIVTTANADPIASAVSVVSFENFVVSWASDGRQVDSSDFTTLTVNSRQQTSATFVDGTNQGEIISSSSAENLYSDSVVGGAIDPVITGIPGDSSTAFNVPSLPLVGNFAASASNEEGSPISNFGVATDDFADLHNASYASLDSAEGVAGTFTNSTLGVNIEFVVNNTPDLNGDALVFTFDYGAYIGAFLSAGEAQGADASWSVNLSLIGPAGPAAFFAIGDSTTNPAPGSGVTEEGFLNSSLTGGLVDLTSETVTSAPIVAGETYRFSASIFTSATVERVPAPAALALMAVGLLGMGAVSRKRKAVSA